MLGHVMSSSFTWLDYSERDRRRMLDVVDLFREKETRDELGIGVVRDAFADMLFPGTSTIQTRARYFLFIPWIYRDLERRRIGSAQVAAEARKREIYLTKALIGSEDDSGVFGKQAGASLKRLPSSVYWQGLGTWGIRLFPGSQDQYHRTLHVFYASIGRRQLTDDGEPVDGPLTRNWHAGLPSAPADFMKSSSFKLTTGEAEYLRERIMTSAPDTMLAYLVDQRQVLGTPDFPWLYPGSGTLPARIREQLFHARNFSEAMHGAALLYNLMLSEARGVEELKSSYRERLTEWASSLEERAAALENWDRAEFWEIVIRGEARVAHPTRAFVDAWLDLALAPGVAASMPDNEAARRLIEDRELALKRGLARLHNRSALELWGGAAGAEQLWYRWSNARVIIADILAGLEEEGHGA